MSVRDPESGQTTVVMTLFLAAFLLAFIALGIDVEALFHAKRQAQAAADAAAVAAAEEAPSIPNEVAAANAVAKMNGFDTGLLINPAVVTVNQIPLSGNYTTAASGSYLEVIVSQPIRTLFAGMVTHKTTMVVAARAVGMQTGSSPSCVCLEGASGTTLKLDNNATFNPTGCGTTVNSTGGVGTPAITITGGATVGGTSIGAEDPTWNTPKILPPQIAAGTTAVQGLKSGCSPPVPLMPTFDPALCTAEPTGGAWGNFDVGPYSAYGNTQSSGVVCYKGLTVGSNGATVNLRPGVYVIKDGSLHFLSGTNSKSNTGGSGVTFYLTGTASLTIDNGANVNLIAPITGTYAGIVIYQDPGDSTLTIPRLPDTQSISIQGGANTNFSGAIFAPSADVAMGNGSAQTVGAAVIAKTMHLYGGTTLNSTPMPGLGTYVVATAKLAE